VCLEIGGFQQCDDIKVDVYNFAISKIHLITHEQNYFSKCHKLQTAIKNNWNKKVIP
jgi:hypothetical protein